MTQSRRNLPFAFPVFVFTALIVFAGCDFAQPIGNATPTLDVSPPPETLIPTPSNTPDLVTTATASPLPMLEQPSSTFTPGPPTETYTPSATPGPYEYTIQTGDTLGYILQQPPFFYTEPSIYDEVLALNPFLTSIDRLPPVGSILLIPRQTATPIPEGFDLTQALLPNAPPQTAQSGFGLANAEIVQVPVEEGDSIISLAARNNTTLVILATLNPELQFFNCNFNNPSGGPDCNVLLSVGIPVNIPALTPTPTLSPTFSGSETPTPVPTYAPPSLIFPPNNGSASARTFQLQWVSAGILAPEEVYLVQIEDTTNGATHTAVTRNTSVELPESMIPSDGQTHTVRWRVSIAVPNEQGTYRIISGGADDAWRTFLWQSRTA